MRLTGIGKQRLGQALFLDCVKPLELSNLISPGIIAEDGVDVCVFFILEICC